MQVTGIWRLTRATRALAAAVGLMALLALQPEPARMAEWAAARATSSATATPALILSDQARRFLALQYRAYRTEFMGCMIGEIRGKVVIVQRIAPADVDPPRSTATHVMSKQTCERAGWKGTVGMIHSHLGGDRCWYYFPGTEVPSSDRVSFLHTPYPVDAIMCGDRVVWISRDMAPSQIPLVDQVKKAAPGAGKQDERKARQESPGSNGPVGGD